MNELKPCPFCGGEFGKIILRTPKTGEYRHWDNGCVLSFFFINEEDIKAWNRRDGAKDNNVLSKERGAK